MGNCLITKLKTSVANNNLHFLGSIVFYIPANLRAQVGIAGRGKVTLLSDSENVYFTNSTYTANNGKINDLTQTGNMYIINDTNETIKAIVSDYYSVKGLFVYDRQNGVYFDPSDNGDWIKYLSDEMDTFSVTGNSSIGMFHKLNIDNLVNKTRITRLLCYLYNGEAVHLSTFSNHVVLENVRFNNTNIVGVLSDLNECIRVNSLTFLYTSVTGKLKELFTTYHSKGKGTLEDKYKTLTCTFNGGVSFDGETYSGNRTLVATFSTSGIIVTENDSTIATYDGSTWTYNS